MRKGMYILVAATVIIFAMATGIGARQLITADEAIEIFRRKPEAFEKSEEEFVFELSESQRDPNVVLFATSIEGVFDGVSLEDIYELHDELGSSRAVVEYLTEQDRVKLEAKRDFGKISEEEKIAAREEYQRLVSEGAGPAERYKIDSEAIRRNTSYSGALYEYKKRPGLFAFENEEHLMDLMKNRLPGEVMWAGSVAKAHGVSLDLVFSLIDENVGDYAKVFDIMVREYPPVPGAQH